MSGTTAPPYDEARTADGRVRAAYSGVLDGLAARDLESLARATGDWMARTGTTFGDDDHPFVVDPVPRVLTRQEWEGLAAGAAQRVRALDAFVADVHGERRAVREGIVPERVLARSAWAEPGLDGEVIEAGVPWIGLAGLDLVRDADGTFRVLEDNARTPSGIAYALAAADAQADVLGDGHPCPTARAECARALRRVLEASAGPRAPREGALVLLTDGPGGSAHAEHAILAEDAGLVLATAAELRAGDDGVRTLGGTPVRAVYRRTGEDHVRLPDGSLADEAALLLGPSRAGRVGLVNRFGTGVADDKGVYPYVDDMVRLYLDEEPRLPSVRTYDLDDPAVCADVLDRLAELVVKPRDGQGGAGVVVGPRATADELARARRAVAEEPSGWVAQDVVSLSTCPAVVDGALAPRHVDLRVFVAHDGVAAEALPAALTRVALAEGEMVVNSSRDGGAKATWVR